MFVDVFPRGRRLAPQPVETDRFRGFAEGFDPLFALHPGD